MAIKITHSCSICGYGYNAALIEYDASGNMTGCGHHWTDLEQGVIEPGEFTYISKDDGEVHTARSIDWNSILD